MKTEWLRYAFEELHHVNSIQDARNLTVKLPFFINRLSGKSGARALPLALQIEPTNACNIACRCCSRTAMKRAVGFMELGLFRKIIDDAAAQKVRLVYLYLHGEPFLHPDIMEMIAYLKLKGLAVVITTNGTLLDAERAERLLGCGLTNADHLVFSVLGHTKETHEDIMRGVDHYEVVKNIEGLLMRRKRAGVNGPIIEAIIYEMQENRHEIDDFISRWRGVVDHVRKPAAISEQFAERGTSRRRTVPCKNLQERLTVFWNGDVCLCHADTSGAHYFGDLKTGGIREIWNGHGLAGIRQAHLRGELDGMPLCTYCDW